MIAHAATIVLAAFLLFLVQPLIGRYILPLYGGAPGVWTVALLFFQSALLAGYTYAYLLTRIRSRRVQGGLHALLVMLGLAFMPVIPSSEFALGDAPTLEILLLLVGTVGLPFALLAATSPLLQAWLVGEAFATRVFRLYALSNVGSLLALVAYPFAIEPWLGRDAQAWVWSGAYLVFAVASVAVSIRRSLSRRPELASENAVEAADHRLSLSRRLVWVALSACAVWMLMAVTNRMTINIAPTPFLWVLPLALYLLSFVISFSGVPWYRRRLLIPLMLGAFFVFSVAASSSIELVLPLRIVLFSLALLVVCVVLHAELYALRPSPARLTTFYLSIAVGGVVGGLIVGVFAQYMFDVYWEFEIGQVLCLVAVLAAIAVDKSSKLYRFRMWYAWVGIAFGLLFWLELQVRTLQNQLDGAIESRRSFFGVSRVTEDESVRTLVHGTTNHGAQFQDDRRNMATTYFGSHSGIGQALAKTDGPRRVGVVGLGVGTLASYGREGDTFWFYELDGAVEDLAREHFTYLSDSNAEIVVRIGDGRLLLAEQETYQFDILVLDAFSSDAVPVHLLTLEAFEIYTRQIAPDGLIAVNVTNHNLDLQPIVAAAAGHYGWSWKLVEGRDEAQTGQLYSAWMLLSSEASVVDRLLPGELNPPTRELPAWTDDFSNLFRILR
ncbi:MAG: fused MFS/spermidine synthase [Planctomycetota bacterium]